VRPPRIGKNGRSAIEGIPFPELTGRLSRKIPMNLAGTKRDALHPGEVCELDKVVHRIAPVKPVEVDDAGQFPVAEDQVARVVVIVEEGLPNTSHSVTGICFHHNKIIRKLKKIIFLITGANVYCTREIRIRYKKKYVR
jgi:hypothetical protein